MANALSYSNYGPPIRECSFSREFEPMTVRPPQQKHDNAGINAVEPV
jgi:hypothetical protein